MVIPLSSCTYKWDTHIAPHAAALRFSEYRRRVQLNRTTGVLVVGSGRREGGTY